MGRLCLEGCLVAFCVSFELHFDLWLLVCRMKVVGECGDFVLRFGGLV